MNVILLWLSSSNKGFVCFFLQEFIWLSSFFLHKGDFFHKMAVCLFSVSCLFLVSCCPYFFMIICKRFGIESLRFLKYFVDISWHHTFFSSSCSISRLGVFFSDIFFFILCQQFSIRFKSGLLSGFKSD